MTHSYPHKERGDGVGGSTLDYSCEECMSMNVGHLDDKNFMLLAGQTRREFEMFLQLSYDKTEARGLYNFWYAIMESSAVKAFARREELVHRIAEKGNV